MKIFNYLIIGAVALTAAAVASCSGASKDAESDSAEAPVVMSVDSVMANAEEFVGDTITIEGVCTHLCKHGGRKAFLANADTTVIIRCEATPAIGGAFSPDCVGKTLVVNGVWTPQIMSRDQLAQIVEAQNAGEGEHCNTEEKASGPYAGYLTAVDEQIAAGGDSTIVVGYYLEANSYEVPVQ